MTHSESARGAAGCTLSPATGITVYGCGPDEAALFREKALRFGVSTTITDSAASEANTGLAAGNRCISVGHKTRITRSTLLALRRAVAERLKGFGSRILFHDRRPRAANGYVSLDELLRLSDIVTLHAPLTTDTYHLLDRRRIDGMKDGAFVINTGRGPLIDTEALVAALEGGRLGGAALDVVEGEEGIFYADCRNRHIESKALLRLQEMPNVLITPHTAYYTEHALIDTVENSIINCLEFERRNQHG